jgi:hypothetical protein
VRAAVPLESSRIVLTLLFERSTVVRSNLLIFEGSQSISRQGARTNREQNGTANFGSLAIRDWQSVSVVTEPPLPVARRLMTRRRECVKSYDIMVQVESTLRRLTTTPHSLLVLRAVRYHRTVGNSCRQATRSNQSRNGQKCPMDESAKTHKVPGSRHFSIHLRSESSSWLPY